MDRVFVYGTLRAGESRNEILTVEPNRFAGPASVDGAELFSLGSFPAMVLGRDGSVVGEVYEVDARTLQLLDRIEGVPRLYQRTEVELTGGGRAWAYTMAKRPGNAERIEGGDWVEFQKGERA
jgi:gamma-glutamylcyclotransferase (GGCT)/AIG2-like uncharacterized protein YtfP